MKKALIATAAAAVLLAACGRPSLPTVEGRVVDATIYSVTLLTEAGDSVIVSTRGTDPLLVPGVLGGDEVRIACELLPDGETLRAVELDILAPSSYRVVPGVWRDCSGADEIGLVLAEDGSAQAVGLKDLTLQDWSLDGDMLVLSAVDPANTRSSRTLLYHIEKLDADSLVVAPVDAGARRLSLSRSE